MGRSRSPLYYYYYIATYYLVPRDCGKQIGLRLTHNFQYFKFGSWGIYSVLRHAFSLPRQWKINFGLWRTHTACSILCPVPSETFSIVPQTFRPWRIYKVLCFTLSPLRTFILLPYIHSDPTELPTYLQHTFDSCRTFGSIWHAPLPWETFS